MLRKLVFKISIFLFGFNFHTFSQNLITNGSFENITQCPDNSGQIEYANSWINPTQIGTPELFNSCSSIIGVPSYCFCDYAYQYPSSGNGYVGMWLFQNDFSNVREYIQTNLTSQLVNNECYLVNFKVNLLNGSAYAINSFGAFLSNNQIFEDSNFFNYYPQIYSNKMIKDTLNWVDIKGIYTSNGNENYLTIGNFSNDLNFDKELVNTNTVSSGAYYLVDDVSVIAISDLPNFMPANAGPDIELTEGDSTFIGQEISNLNCTWSILGGAEIVDSISGIYVQPTENTTYVVEQNLCGVTTYDTVTVFVHGVGLEESSPLPPSKGGVGVSPNPNDGSFDIDLSKLNSSLQNISILDASGRVVYEEKSVLSKNRLSIQAHLEKGIYFLRVATEKGIFEEKLVIQ